MLTLYTFSEQRLKQSEYALSVRLPEDVVWVDMLEPSYEEEQLAESALHLDVPTRDEIREIEASSRLYKKMGMLFMTVTVIAKADAPRPETTEVTFILAGARLITVRYAAVQSFTAFISRQQREDHAACDGEQVLMGLLDVIVDNVADILEQVGADLDAVSQEIFNRNEAASASRYEGSLQDFLRRIGRNGDVTSKASESLVSLARLLAFLRQPNQRKHDTGVTSSLDILDRDVRSLTSHATFLADKATFLLSATLGMINIEQTDIIKIFSVAAVIFLPPTLVASIYGMNFQFMPELHWEFGYPFAIMMMIISAILPYRFFKRRGWV
jgi:magnesium transporter